jgi:hypothetical protein
MEGNGGACSMKYPLVFYVDTLPNGFGGMAHGPIVCILKRLRGDEGIRQHELTHVRQWFWTLGLLPLLYLIPQFKLGCEVQAYRVQLQYYPDDRSWQFAGFIATRYGLNITQLEAHALLIKP